MIRDELRVREAALDAKLDDAGKRADQGDRENAIAIYKSVREQRCLFPRQARDAARALRKLGVEGSGSLGDVRKPLQHANGETPLATRVTHVAM